MKKGNVKIRPITLEDTENIIKWRNNPSVRNNFIYRDVFTKETHLNWYNNRILTGDVVQFIIYSDVLSKDVGSVYLRDIDKVNQKAEFGIFIGEDDCRGLGIGTKATSLILDYGFNELGLNRIFLRVFKRNIGAIKAYKNAGFIEEGIFREDVMFDGKGEDMVYMGILKSDVK
ncbi:MAG: GNAT family N-acetyltransferase [Ruminococcaceae bacterium]|nr:GNAT family N-acetyltransferase [Oscillospiraceae bacterium]